MFTATIWDPPQRNFFLWRTAHSDWVARRRSLLCEAPTSVYETSLSASLPNHRTAWYVTLNVIFPLVNPPKLPKSDLFALINIFRCDVAQESAEKGRLYDHDCNGVRHTWQRRTRSGQTSCRQASEARQRVSPFSFHSLTNRWQYLFLRLFFFTFRHRSIWSDFDLLIKSGFEPLCGLWKYLNRIFMFLLEVIYQ